MKPVALRRVVMIVFLLAFMDSGSAQVPRTFDAAGANVSATQVISPVALVTWITQAGSEGNAIDLIVLWRGTPGWFLRGSNARASGGGDGETFHSTISYGGIDLELVLGLHSRIARIQGKEVRLLKDNVILVDRVDSVDGPQIIKTLAVDSHLPEARRVESALRSSNEIVNFLHCDTPLPDQQAQAMVDRICRQVMGK
jgi:hypothetical protein